MKRITFKQHLEGAILAECSRKRHICWFDKLPDDAQQAISATASQFHEGQLGASRKAVAKAILQCITQECGASVSIKSVDEWLAKQRPT